MKKILLISFLVFIPLLLLAGTWQQTGDLNVGRKAPGAILLDNGKVLVIGSIGNKGILKQERSIR